jgi:uncharacterized protein
MLLTTTPGGPTLPPARDNLPPILPVGTAVVMRAEVRSKSGELVVPAGAVGVVISAPLDPQHQYRIRFTGGEEVSARRDEFDVLKHYQRPGCAPADRMAEYDLNRFVIFRCLVGSRAYGLECETSDHDRRGIYLPPAEMHWSLYGVPEQLENEATQECYWEIQKFLDLALKANPNILEVLHSPIVEHVAPIAQELLDMRGLFLTKLVYQTYNGYVLSQFKKLETDIRNHGTIKWKHAMHLVRLLLSGITILREGRVPVQVTEHRERLLTIRDGRMPWDEVNAWRLDLHRQFDAAFARTTLPQRPDYAVVNDYLVRARRSMVQR